MSGSLGTLSVTLLQATGLKDSSLIGAQSPYCNLRLGKDRYRSCTCTNGGTAPVWNESFKFPVKEADSELTIEILNKNAVAKDGEVGTANFPISTAMANGHDDVVQNVIDPSGNMVGTVSVIMRWDATQTPAFVETNGILKVNPELQPHRPPSTLAYPDVAVLPVTDLQHINEQNICPDAANIQVSATVTSTVEITKDQQFLSQFGPDMDSDALLEGLGDVFAQYEVPVGLMSKLFELRSCFLEFLQDDSGSMRTEDAKRQSDGSRCSRWDEAKERMLLLVDILSYIPVQGVRISFLNRSNQVYLSHNGRPPAEFKADAFHQIEAAYSEAPRMTTPICAALEPLFREAEARECKSAVYLLFDGRPDRGGNAVADIIMRRNHAKIPFTFLSCTSNDADVEWAKEVDEMKGAHGQPTFIAELDDFESERNEVLRDQGEAMPYSYGMYLICNLVAAFNPTDLDMLDESIPFTKRTMDELMGRRLSPQEYQKYWTHFMNNTHAPRHARQEMQRLWGRLADQFAREDLQAVSIPEVARHMGITLDPPPPTSGPPLPPPGAPAYGGPYGAPAAPRNFSYRAPYAPPPNPNWGIPPASPQAPGQPQTYAPQAPGNPLYAAPMNVAMPPKPQPAQPEPGNCICCGVTIF